MSSGVGGPGGPRRVGDVESSGTPEVEGAAKPQAPFRAVGVGATEIGGVEPGAISPLAQLRAGAIDVEQYCELSVQEATRHLEGVLSADDLALVQDELRAALETDPDLAALVQTARLGRP